MQSVAIPIANPGVGSSIRAQSNIFVEIYREIFSTVSNSRKAVVSYERKYVHGVLISCLV